MNKQKIAYLKAFAAECSLYFVNFFGALCIGLLCSILFDIPMKFIRVIDYDLGHFITHFTVMCITLYLRSYRKGYHTNTRTYTFSLRKTALSIFVIFSIQILLVLILGVNKGGHAVYVAGPSRWLANYILTLANVTGTNQYTMYCHYNWVFMLLADVCIYLPIMLAGEYLGAKRNVKSQES